MATTPTHNPHQQVEGPGQPAPVFRRATPQDALDAARALVLGGGRVDMGALASHLGISRATLYRWFGSRELLLEQLLETMALSFIDVAREQATGEGDERVLDIARRFMSTTVEFQPARQFVAREPQLALRLLLGEGGAVHRTLTGVLLAELSATRPPDLASRMKDSVDAMVQVATALQWATFAIGDEPQIERAVQIMRLMLHSHDAEQS